MEPVEYVRIFLRRWPLIAICALIGAGFAFIGTDPEPEPIRETYLAKHTLLSSSNQFSSQQLIGTITLTQVPIFATTGEVPRLAAEQLGFAQPPAVLASKVTVEQDPATGTIEFSTVQDNPDDAVRIADAFADTTVAYLAEQQAEIRENRLINALADIERLETEILELDDEIGAQLLAQAQAEAAGQFTQEVDSITRSRQSTAVREYSAAYESYRELTNNETTDLNMTTLERAQPVPQNTGGFAPPRTRSTRVPIAAFLGALIGAGLALLAERLDSKLGDRRKAEEAFGAAVVSELPTLSRKQRAAHIIVGPDQHHGAAEAFRSLRTSLTFMAAGGQPSAGDDSVGVMVVTSPSPSEGKTTTALNLAAAFAETGRRTVVVNADFRRPIISGLLTDNRTTLPAGLAGITRLDPEDYLTPTTMPGIELLDLSPLGDAPGDLTRGTYSLVTALADRVDVIIIDTPPLAVTTEALEFVPLAAVVLLVGRIGRTATDAAERAGELVRFGGAKQLAIALTDSGSTGMKRNGYYDYYGTGNDKPNSKLSLRRRKRGSTTAETNDADTNVVAGSDAHLDAEPDVHLDAGYMYTSADTDDALFTDDTTESGPGGETTFDGPRAIDPLLSMSDDGPGKS